MNTYRWYFDLWWLIRGVYKTKHYRAVCDRCGRTGQAHFSWRGCWRFKPKHSTIILRHLG